MGADSSLNHSLQRFCSLLFGLRTLAFHPLANRTDTFRCAVKPVLAKT